MPLPEVIKRASSYFLGLEFDDQEEPLDYIDNEILFCKNNVCVHPPTVARHELDIIHHPGYLTVTTKVFTDQHNNTKRPTLFLNWIPNSTLRRCPSAVETSPSDEVCAIKPYKPEEIMKSRKDSKKTDPINDTAFSDSSETTSLTSNSDKHSVQSYNNDTTELSTSSKPTVKSIDSNKDNVFTSDVRDEVFAYDKHVRSQSMTSVNITIANPTIENVDLTPDSVSGERFIRSLSMSSCDEGNPNWMSTPEFLALKHNLVFPDSVHSSPVPQRKTPMKCRSYFLGLEFDDQEEPLDYIDNEILFCKNNVCVHPPTVARHELDIIHHPGYLTVTTKVFTDQHNNTKRPTLFLNWIPNSTLRRCPSAVETSPSDEVCAIKPYKPEEITKSRKVSKKTDPMNDTAFSDSSETTSLTSNSDKHSVQSYNNDTTELSTSSKPTVKSIDSNKDNVFTSDVRDEVFAYDKHVRSQSMTSVNITIANPTIENVDLTPDSVSGERFIRSLSMSSCDEGNPNWMSTPEFLALKHNLVFPDSVHSSPVPQRKTPMKCRRPEPDALPPPVLQRRQLHVRPAGGRLPGVSVQDPALPPRRAGPSSTGSEEPNIPYRHFMVCRPEVQKSEQHPEEGKVSNISPEFFYEKVQNGKGVIEDDLFLRKRVFFGGLDKELRREVWPFLLHCYPYNSTYDEREIILQMREREYEEITRRRVEKMSPEQHAVFWKNVQCVIEKDVVRTDRGNPYTQGMSDLLAPVLCEIKSEAEAFWCFVGLMQRTIFARGLLHQFRQLVRIPCTLAGMCQRCGPGIWDSTHRPNVECTVQLLL
ncbi:Uncharacterized protein OBRU01_21145 [Operophtera brumata]|uniref:Rab-GAP TBC domain-containing protein n=1 Tax=Operophtera brumata TaxID=104452 RepID=A0A0L7KML9_OPEBR|nr:Uncharacterized protein OBRU01_21145 [Operophtera brumata]